MMNARTNTSFNPPDLTQDALEETVIIMMMCLVMYLCLAVCFL
jgi:hypothetical protein